MSKAALILPRATEETLSNSSFAFENSFVKRETTYQHPPKEHYVSWTSSKMDMCFCFYSSGATELAKEWCNNTLVKAGRTFHAEGWKGLVSMSKDGSENRADSSVSCKIRTLRCVRSLFWEDKSGCSCMKLKVLYKRRGRQPPALDLNVLCQKL